LTTLAARISAELRTSDTLARLGGDEFAVILEETNIGQIDKLVDRLRALIAEPVAMDGDRFGVAASIGLACYPEDGADPDVLLRLADEKMYSDKLRQKTNGV
jgi:diguanylate cyclase (GGDEF)-like protein